MKDIFPFAVSFCRKDGIIEKKLIQNLTYDLISINSMILIYIFIILKELKREQKNRKKREKCVFCHLRWSMFVKRLYEIYQTVRI